MSSSDNIVKNFVGLLWSTTSSYRQKTCNSCQLTKTWEHSSSPTGTYTMVAKCFFSCINVEKVCPFWQWFRYLITIIDQLSHYPEVPLAHTIVVQSILMTWMFCFNIPNHPATDYDKQVDCKLFIHLSEMFGIKYIKITASHLKVNGINH